MFKSKLQPKKQVIDCVMISEALYLRTKNIKLLFNFSFRSGW